MTDGATTPRTEATGRTKIKQWVRPEDRHVLVELADGSLIRLDRVKGKWLLQADLAASFPGIVRADVT